MKIAAKLVPCANDVVKGGAGSRSRKKNQE